MRLLPLVCALAACGAHGPFSGTGEVPAADAILRACALQVSCLSNPPAAWMANCTAAFEQTLASNVPSAFSPFDAPTLRRFVDCAVANGDCASALACATAGRDPSWCATHPGLTCDGDVVVDCASAIDGWPLYQTDCAARGLRCAAQGGSAACTDGSSCDPAARDHCDGARFVTCDAQTRLRAPVDCTRWPVANGDCRDGSWSEGSFTVTFHGCLPSGPACAPESSRCDGDRRVRCLGGEEVAVDCRALEAHCSLVDGQASCVSDAGACAAGTQADGCAGTAIRTCYDGQLRTVECTTLGLTRCELVPLGGQPRCR